MVLCCEAQGAWHAWESHTKATLHSLSRLKNFLPISLKKMLVQALEMPHVDYCIVVLANLDDVHTYRLQRIQNASVRFIFNLKNYDHLTSFFNRLQWLKVSQRQEWHSLALLFKILRTRQPSYLFQRFKFLSDHHNRDTRSRANLLLSIPHHNSSFYSKSYTVSVSRKWNELPTSIRDSTSLTSFKSMLYNHLLEQNN